MATFEFKLPDIGEGVVEGEIVKWLVKPGDAVAEDQPMVEVMTDKATVTIPSPKAGKVVKTVGKEGDIAKVHEVLVVLDTAAAGAAAPAPSKQPEAAPAPAAAPPRAPEAAPRASGDGRAAPPPRPAVAPAPPSASLEGVKVLATPATRRLARELGVDIRAVRGSGEAGRVTMDDVRGFAGGAGAQATGTYGAAPTPMPQLRAVPSAPGALEERIPVRGLRKRIAEKMALSEAHAVPFTFVEECDVTDLAEARDRIKKSGIDITYLPFVMKAIVAAMKKHPTVNAVYDEQANELIVKRYYNFGIGVATDAGLTVVVVHDVDKRSIRDLADELKRLADDARAGKSKVEDVQGSTFTITSLGAQGGVLATPVINYPEVAILGIHKIKDTPVVRNGEITIGKMMNISGTFDHRMIDGHVGAAFIYEVIKYLEDPNLLFVEMV